MPVTTVFPPVRAEVLGQVADQIVEAPRPVLVAVDGVDGSGKTWFADELADVLRARGRRVVRASIDDFHHPRDYRHRTGRTPETVWRRHFDYRALRRELLDPWLDGAGASYLPAWHDVATDEHVELDRADVPADGVLLVDGVFAQRRELERAWDLVVWLEVPFEVSVSRMAARDGTVDDVEDPDQRRYVDAQRIYLETCAPQAAADLVVDNTDLERPALLGLPATPRGWADDGEWLVRRVRVARDRPDLVEAIDELAPPRQEP